MRRLLLAAISAGALAVAGCGSITTNMTACHANGGIRTVKVQSVNAAFLLCRDGRVYRYDTGNG